MSLSNKVSWHPSSFMSVGNELLLGDLTDLDPLFSEEATAS